MVRNLVKGSSTENIRSNPPRVVNLVELKSYVRNALPRDSAFREIILNEPDSMPLEEFVPKVDVFLTLLRRDL